MMPTIRVDDDVMQGLKALAEPFVDTPNSVIRRLLQERNASAKPATAPSVEPADQRGTGADKQSNEKPASRGSLTPQTTYEAFLLHLLGTKFGGGAHKHEVTKAVVELMKSRGFINAAELERVSTGETRAENTVAWARNALKERGLIKRLSIRGIWELTPEGAQRAQSVVLPRRAVNAS
jgi:hypothetical protein